MTYLGPFWRMSYRLMRTLRLDQELSYRMISLGLEDRSFSGRVGQMPTVSIGFL